MPTSPPQALLRRALIAAVVAASTGCALKHQFVQAPACPGEDGVRAFHLLEIAPRRAQDAAAAQPARAEGTAPQVALGVSRPSVCNDYPVTYRVIQPDTVARVRSVDQVTVRTSPP